MNAREPGPAGERLELERLASQPSGALVGRAVDRLFAVGPVDPCGQCEVCRRGGAAVCATPAARELDGNRVVVAARWAVELGGGLELPLPAAAAVGGDVATAYTLYARTGLGPRDPVAVTGANAVTRFLVEVLRAKGLVPLVIVDAAGGGSSDGDGAWPAWLAKVGAVACRSPAEVTPALVAQGLGARPLRVIATGDYQAAYALAGPRATLTVLAAANVPALPADLVAREVVVIGVAGAHPDLITEVAALCVRGQIDLAGGVGDGPTQARVATH